jgi:hypothetical protein
MTNETRSFPLTLSQKNLIQGFKRCESLAASLKAKEEDFLQWFTTSLPGNFFYDLFRK